MAARAIIVESGHRARAQGVWPASGVRWRPPPSSRARAPPKKGWSAAIGSGTTACQNGRRESESGHHRLTETMKITGAKVIVCSPGRNFVTLKLETDAGVYGLGDAPLNGRAKGVVRYLGEHVL